MPDIVISYRRDDSPGHAGRLAEFLRQKFGVGAVFLDRTTIRPGQPFPRAIRSAIESCKVILVLIGRDWKPAELFEANDWVHYEIATAFELRKTVVPVLVEDAAMPHARELPEDIAQLADCQYVRLSEDYWDAAIRDLAQKLSEDHAIPMRSEQQNQAWIQAFPQLVTYTTVCVCCVVLVLLFGLVAVIYMTDRTLEITKFAAITAAIVLVLLAVTRIQGFRSLQR